ncbi:hypothetical protein CCUS01_07983, partial [Colletotrichum cuscutae]
SKRHPQVFVLAGHPAALGVERKNAPGTGQVQAHRLDVSHPIPTRLPGRNSNFARTCSSSEDEEGGPAFTTALMYPSTPADGSSTIRFRPGILLLRCHKVVNEDRYVALHPGQRQAGFHSTVEIVDSWDGAISHPRGVSCLRKVTESLPRVSLPMKSNERALDPRTRGWVTVRGVP